METLAMTPEVLDRISNEIYQEKDKWKIDDIALGAANELLISGHNLEIPQTCISMYKEDSGKYGDRPEFHKNFDQTQPGEQFVLFLEDRSIIGLKTECALQFFTIKDMCVLKTLKWKRSPACLCVYRGKLYKASSSSTTVSVCQLDSKEKSAIFCSDMRSDCVLEMVVAMEKIYVCTKNKGRALVFSMTGSKKMEFINAIQTDAMAKSICIHERTELVFVSWSNFQIQLYSQKTSRCLLAFDMTEKLHKIRVTTENMLVTLSASKCIVTVYDVGEVIKFAELRNNILSSVKKKHQKKLMSHDEENPECHPAISETHTTIFLPWKSASKQSKYEKLRRKYDRDIQQLTERIQEQNGIRRDLESQQQKLKDSLVQEKKRVTREERSRVQVETNLKVVEDRNTKLEAEVTQLKERLLAKEQTSKELQTSSLKLNERIKELEFTKKEQESQQKKLKDKLVQEKTKVSREERSRDQLNKRIKELEFTRKELESQQKKLKDSLVQEKRKVSREERSRDQLKERVKELEFTRKELESQQKKLKDNLVEEKRKLSREERLRVQILETQEDDKRIPRDENLQGVMHSMKGNIKRLGEEFSKSKAVLNELDKSTVEQEADKMQLTLALSNVSDDTLLQNGQDSVLLKKEASFKSLEISRGELSEECERFPKEVTLAPFPSDSFKFGESQRHDRYPYWFNDAEAAVSELMDSGDVTSNLETDECCSGLIAGNVDQVNPELKVAVTVSIKGTKMLIPDTGVELYVPWGSLLSRQLIEINIIDFDNDKFDTLFSLDRNSSVAVQLLPNKSILRWPARLRLPHCLRLKANFEELKSQVKVYRSEHAPGQEAQWEHDPELRYELKEDCCIIFVKKLCSIRYDVTEEAIDATNVTVFTAGKQHGTSMELAVGYHLDLPGRREMLLTKKSDMKIFNAKPFEFVKDSTDNLQVHLTTAVSRAHNDEETTEVVGKLSVSEAAARIAELPLNRPKPLYSSDAPGLEGNLHISTAILKVSETVSNKGTTMRILDTGIELTIPPYAVKGYQYIEMSVIPFGTLDAPISTFSSNSSLTVELLPNGATFSTPVRLSLPHCLKLKKSFSKRSVKLYLSHHEKDQKPFWEELPDAKYELKADHCVIYLTSFCWVKYEIDNKIVVAKRIKVYTATRGMEQNDQVAEVEVGYFIDMPGRAENLRENVDLKISQCKPLLFFRDGNLPLQIFLIKVLPMFWKYSTPDRNPKVIPFKRIADSVDTSLPFVFENQDSSEQKPFVMFKVSQGNEEVEINIRL